MKISMWTSYLIELSPEEMVKTFVDRDYQYSELSDEHGWMLLERGDPEKIGCEFRKFAADLGFSFPQGHFYLSADIAHPDPKERSKILDDLKRWCDLFNALGVKAGVLHPDKSLPTESWSKEQMLECRIGLLEELLQYSQGYSFTICLENLTRLYKTYEDLAELINSVSHNERLAICLDTGHLNMMGGDNIEFVKKAGSLLQALHITDSIDKYDHMLPCGAGNINWGEFVKALKEINYQGLFNYEVPKENNCPMPIRLAKLDYAKKLAELLLEL